MHEPISKLVYEMLRRNAKSRRGGKDMTLYITNKLKTWFEKWKPKCEICGYPIPRTLEFGCSKYYKDYEKAVNLRKKNKLTIEEFNSIRERLIEKQEADDEKNDRKEKARLIKTYLK